RAATARESRWVTTTAMAWLIFTLASMVAASSTTTTAMVPSQTSQKRRESLRLAGLLVQSGLTLTTMGAWIFSFAGSLILTSLKTNPVKPGCTVSPDIAFLASTILWRAGYSTTMVTEP